MSDDRQDEQWIRQARRLLDESAEGLDAATRSRLNGARQRALAARARPRRDVKRWWTAGALAATAATLVLALLLWAPVSRHAPGEILGDLELLSSSDPIEIYEDLDFYEWLELDAHTG